MTEAKAKATKPLSVKRRAFVDAYLATGNATEAYRRAGYKGTGHTAEVEGSRLLRNPEVRAAIEEGQREPKAKAEMSRRDLRRFWSEVARGNVDDWEERLVRDEDGTRLEVEQARAKLRDRLKATELLGKSRGMFVEKHEHKIGTDTLVALVDAVAGLAPKPPEPDGSKPR